jgi:hypothetical protein
MNNQEQHRCWARFQKKHTVPRWTINKTVRGGRVEAAETKP